MHIKPFYTLLVLLASCTLPQDKNVEAVIREDDTAARLQSTEQDNARSGLNEGRLSGGKNANATASSLNADGTASNTNNGSNDTASGGDDDLSLPLPAPQAVKRPRGIYQTRIPFERGMDQIIAFYDNETYRLQEKYAGHKKDSIVITEGNWSLSDGIIWLYKDQVVRGRYSWKGDTLQYVSPFFQKNFSMRPLQDAAAGGPNGDLVLSGSGNEPMWNLSFTSKDSVSFSLAKWEQPVQLRLLSSARSKDSVAYTARNDSAELRITVYPQFCVDGQSDIVYRHRIRVAYNNQVYYGCGTLYR